MPRPATGTGESREHLILEVLGQQWLTTKQVAARTGIGTTYAHVLLQRLAAQGAVTKHPGLPGRGRPANVWTRID